MAVKNTNIDIKLQIRLANGVTASGKTAVKNINFNNVKLSATDDELYAAGTAVAGLIDTELTDIRRIDTDSLTSQA